MQEIVPQTTAEPTFAEMNAELMELNREQDRRPLNKKRYEEANPGKSFEDAQREWQVAHPGQQLPKELLTGLTIEELKRGMELSRRCRRSNTGPAKSKGSTAAASDALDQLMNL